MSKDFFNIEDILNNNNNNNRNRSNSSRNNGPSFNNVSRNSSNKSRQQYNQSPRNYPDFDLEKARSKSSNVNKSYNSKFNNFDLEEMKGNKFDFSNSRTSNANKNSSTDKNSNSNKNGNNSRNADIYIMDQEVSSEFISAIEDDKKQFSDPKPRKGRKLYGDGLYSSQELEKAPELVKITPVEEQKTKSKKTLKKKRSSYLIFSVVVIFIFFIALIFLLLNQSRVMQVSYENAAIKNQIANLEKDNAERIERLAREADLNDVAKKAARNGFQIPNRKQRVEVKDDKLDQIVYFDENNNAIGIVSEEVDMDLVFSSIEKYILEKEESLKHSEKSEETKIESDSDGDTKVANEIEGGENAE